MSKPFKHHETNPINPGHKVEDANIGDPRPEENNSPGVVAWAEVPWPPVEVNSSQVTKFNNHVDRD